MRTFDQLVARLRSPEGGGFDVSQARAAEIVNQAIRRLVVDSRFLKDELELGPGDGIAQNFALPDEVVDVLGLMVDGDPRYARCSTQQFWQLRAGDRVLPAGRTGAYAPRFDSESKLVAISPIPELNGAITTLVALSSPNYSGGQRPPLPDDLEDAIEWQAKSIAYEELDEDLPTAQALADRAGIAAGELRKRETARVGGGVIQAQLYGVHFR